MHQALFKFIKFVTCVFTFFFSLSLSSAKDIEESFDVPNVCIRYWKQDLGCKKDLDWKKNLTNKTFGHMSVETDKYYISIFDDQYKDHNKCIIFEVIKDFFKDFCLKNNKNEKANWVMFYDADRLFEVYEKNKFADKKAMEESYKNNKNYYVLLSIPKNVIEAFHKDFEGMCSDMRDNKFEFFTKIHKLCGTKLKIQIGGNQFPVSEMKICSVSELFDSIIGDDRISETREKYPFKNLGYKIDLKKGIPERQILQGKLVKNLTIPLNLDYKLFPDGKSTLNCTVFPDKLLWYLENPNSSLKDYRRSCGYTLSRYLKNKCHKSWWEKCITIAVYSGLFLALKSPCSCWKKLDCCWKKVVGVGLASFGLVFEIGDYLFTHSPKRIFNRAKRLNSSILLKISEDGSNKSFDELRDDYLSKKK